MSVRISIFGCMLCMALVSVASAAYVGFNADEGYLDATPLDGQPTAINAWSCAGGISNSIFVTRVTSSTGEGRLAVSLSNEHGPSSEMATEEYATKRMVPVAGEFIAGFSVGMSWYAGDMGDETIIALGQNADSNWGVYIGLNKTNHNSIAYHNGTNWVEICDGLTDGLNNSYNVYDVEIIGDISLGTFAVSVFEQDQRVAGNPASGFMGSANATFRDSPTELGYVMLTNKGSTKDAGAYHHNYDDLYLVPEPLTMSLLGLGSLALIRRRKA